MGCNEYICSYMAKEGYRRICKITFTTCLGRNMKACDQAYRCQNCNNISCDIAFELKKASQKNKKNAKSEEWMTSGFNECENYIEEDIPITVPDEKIHIPVAVTKEPQKTPYAYVDGSYNPYTKTYGYGGFVYDGERHLLQGSGNEAGMAAMRNVAGEIMGAMAAIEYAIINKYKEIIIYYDYMGIEMWATGKWQANKEGTQKYKEYCKNSPVKLIFKKVPAHKGIAGNELADNLAKKAVGLC